MVNLDQIRECLRVRPAIFRLTMKKERKWRKILPSQIYAAPALKMNVKYHRYKMNVPSETTYTHNIFI